MPKNDTLKSGTSHVGVDGSAPLGCKTEVYLKISEHKMLNFSVRKRY